MTRLVLPILLIALSGCRTYTTGVDNRPSERGSRYVAVDTPTAFGTTGIESQDIVAMTNRMTRDMLASPALVKRTAPAVVIIDEVYFKNESTQPMNKKLIVDRLRNELFRAAQGRMRFVARHATDMVDDEQIARTEGRVGGDPTMRRPKADYRLFGRFQNLPDGDNRGRRSNYVQVVFEMIDLDSTELVWSGLYEFKKLNRESIVYQ